ncbi:hypothetical protein [Nonomuraea pusilla]|uniref:hypothetical protein n=1 Tax=Nonomuraea pusilla TaxID=46177 RepID=UPI001160266C|nr:hypothetical protein [Nonomuraea pusilla]
MEEAEQVRRFGLMLDDDPGVWGADRPGARLRQRALTDVSVDGRRVSVQVRRLACWHGDAPADVS